MNLNAVTFAAYISITSSSHALQLVPGDMDMGNQEKAVNAQNIAAFDAERTSEQRPLSRMANESEGQALARHRMLKYFAVEARIGNLGEYRREDNFDPVQSEFATYTGNAVGILPFGDSGVELYGQLGAGLIANRMDSTFSEAQSSTAVGTYGLGFRYTRSSASPLSLTAGYNAYRFQAANDSEPGRSDQMLSKASLGLQYDF
jgi:hypothetical protein